jgi:DNA polymerase-4
MGERKILHLDLDAFFCAVEELRQPDLRGTPFAVGGKPGERGVVSSCSYSARRVGVHSAMPMGQAVQLCRDLRIVPPDHAAYSAASEQVMAILRDLTPLVEQLSIDEAFLDVSDLPEPGESIARRLQEKVLHETRLPCSLGVASNKLVAKIATDVGKAEHRGINAPQAIKVVPAGREAEFLAPLPVHMLWGVGKKTDLRLQELGVRTIGDLARLPEQALSRLFGKNGIDFARHARGQDDRPVVNEHEMKSISQEITFDRDVGELPRLKDTLKDLAAQVAFRLRQSDLRAGTVRLKLRWSDFTTISRQATLAQPVDQDGLIYATVERLCEAAWQPGRKVRLIGVGTSNLVSQPQQPGLWDTPSEKERRLLDAVDELREKFGSRAILPGRTLRLGGTRKIDDGT